MAFVRFIIRRLLAGIVVLWVVSLAAFGLFFARPATQTRRRFSAACRSMAAFIRCPTRTRRSSARIVVRNSPSRTTSVSAANSWLHTRSYSVAHSQRSR